MGINMTRARAFTLIELLVATLIIAVLVSILIPQLAGVRKAARSTKCLSNLRQLAVSMNTYAVVNNRFPRTEEIADARLQHLTIPKIVQEDETLTTLPVLFRCSLDNETPEHRSSYAFIPARFMRAVSDNSDYLPIDDSEGIDSPRAIVRLFDFSGAPPLFQDVDRFHMDKVRRASLAQMPSFQGMQASFFDGSARKRE